MCGQRRACAAGSVRVAALVDERGAQAHPHDAAMTGQVECHYYGRDFTAEEMALLRALIAGPPLLNRHRLSKAFCRRIGWLKPDGGLKDMMARVTMLDMHRDGLIVLPPPTRGQNRPGPIVFGPDTDAPLEPPPTALDDVRPLNLRPVLGRTPQSLQWNAFIGPLPLSRIQNPGGRPDALHRPRPRWPADRPARLLHCGMEAGPARPLHRMDAAPCARKTSRLCSTTRGSLSCPGSPSPTWVRTSSP